MPGHAEKLEKLVQDAVAKGAKVAARGQFVKGVVGHGQVGQFFLPTVLVDVNHSMTIMQEEVGHVWYSLDVCRTSILRYRVKQVD